MTYYYRDGSNKTINQNSAVVAIVPDTIMEIAAGMVCSSGETSASTQGEIT